jgi:signal transduction histidine kinase
LNYSNPSYPNLDAQTRLAMIHDRAKMMFSLIDDIMDVYKADKLSVNVEANSIYQASQQSIDLITDGKKSLPIIENLIPKEATAIFQFNYIKRVIENLLSNSVKYTETD